MNQSRPDIFLAPIIIPLTPSSRPDTNVYSGKVRNSEMGMLKDWEFYGGIGWLGMLVDFRTFRIENPGQSYFEFVAAYLTSPQLDGHKLSDKK